MKRYNISKTIACLSSLALWLVLMGCGGNDDIGTTTPDKETKNVNANRTDKSQYATRIEVPKLHQGTAFLFLAKEDPTFGVNYIVEWDCAQKAQRWTCWEWNSDNARKDWNRNNWKSGATFNGYGGNGDPFQPDGDILADFRSELADYSGSGYNRGHICASEDRICNMNCNGQTFYLSNMHPQIYDFNGGVWEHMESKVRNWRDAIVKQGGTMYVSKGGTLYDVTIDGKTMPGVIKRISGKSVYEVDSPKGIPVPKYFFMAILAKTSNGYSSMAFWAEHKADNSTNLQNYMITVDELEKRTGYDFFCNLPDNIEDTVEATLITTQWK